jgi:membrane-associated phospholipid phosphatase
MADTNELVTKQVKKFSVALIILLLTLLAVVVVFVVITQEIVLENENGFDTSILSLVAKYHNAQATTFMHSITFFGSRLFLLPAYIVIVISLLLSKRTKDSIGIAAVALCGAGILMLLKNIFRRARPSDALAQKISSFSYPSGHSFSAFTFAGILMYITWRSKLQVVYKWIITISLFLFALLISFSRIYLHVHYPSDVLAGFCVSLLWLSLSYYLLKRFRLI